MSDEQLTPNQFLMRSFSLIDALYEPTLDGDINWEESRRYGSGAFEAEFGDVGVVIREVPDQQYPQEPDYYVYIIKTKAGPLGRTEQVVETITNQSLRPLMERVNTRGLNPYTILRDTYRMARRKALKVDDTLEDLLEHLKRPSPK